MKKVIILGAAGRDFHNFNLYFRDNEEYRVVAFTAAQIPFIADRVYPRTLAGRLYPNGIPIYDESMLEDLIIRYQVDEVVFSYSDVSYEYVMSIASRAIASGASFKLLGLKHTQLSSSKRVIAVTANRTGAGKSTITRVIANLIKEKKRVAIIRHPMPYLTFEAVQHFKGLDDLTKHRLSIEEEEEYITHLKDGNEVYAGIDYSLILHEAEKEHDVIIWDGGNNDCPFIKPDLNIFIIDATRVEDTIRYHPSEVNLRKADIIIINKVNMVDDKELDKCIEICKRINDHAKIFKVGIFARIDKDIKGKRIAIISDAPSITHGGLKDNIVFSLAKISGSIIVEPSLYAKGSIRDMYKKYDIRYMLPTAGYNEEQLKDLEESLNAIECDMIILATPSDLARRIKIDKPIANVEVYVNGYDYDSFLTYLKEWIEGK